MITLEQVDSFIHAIDQAENIDQVFEGLKKNLQPLGFENFSYWLNWPPVKEDRQLYISNYPKIYLEHYVKNKFRSKDLVGSYSAQTSVPFLWTEIKENFSLTKEQKEVFDDGFSAGLRSGASIPIYGPDQTRATFSLALDEDDEEFKQLFLKYRHPIHLMATYAHEKIRGFHLDQNVKDVILTAREIDILLWAARGKTVWDIHQILGISENTVKIHLQHVKYRLGVHNVTHAVAKAILNGLIFP